MSTSLLYHAFGLRAYEYKSAQFTEGGVQFRVSQPRESLRCSACGSASVFSKGRVPREFRSVPIGSRETTIQWDVPRVQCRDCHRERQVKISFADTKKSYTRAFARYALDLSQHMTLTAVANHLGVGWDPIKGI